MKEPWSYHLSGVCRRFGERTALSIEELRIAAGECCCVIGPVGAGKSTLLRVLAGIDAADEGEVWCGGCRLTSSLPADVQRRITLVFQKPLLLSASVQDNVEYGLRLRRGRATSAKAKAILARLGLEELARRAARTLSGGETQLVAVARALVLEPAVLLLDEPTAHLDPSRVARVEELLAEEHRRLGTTIVWATHNLFQARRVAQRAALLLDGRLIESAAAPAFFESPADPRTAAFVQGRMVY